MLCLYCDASLNAIKKNRILRSEKANDRIAQLAKFL